MRAGRFIHQQVSPEQANLLHQANTNYRRLKKLLSSWEAEAEHWIDRRANNDVTLYQVPR